MSRIIAYKHKLFYNRRMEFIEFEAKEDDDGRRLDKAAKRIFESKGLQPENIFKLIRKTLIKLNNAKSAPEDRIKSGDKIFIADFLLKENAVRKSKTEKKSTQKIHGDISLQTAFKNEHLWIINKQSGIEVQPSKNSSFCLADFVAQNTKTASLSFRPGPLHRIDKFTTGLITFSQSLQGAKWFSENIKNHSIKKTYLAVVENFLPENELAIYDTIEEKTACTKIKKIAQGIFCGKEISLAKIQIETGRKHQIRIHCASRGFPLLGDKLYGGTKIPNGDFSSCGFFLHAWKLEFPKDNPLLLPSEIQAEISPLFKKFIENFLKIPTAEFII